MKTTRVLPADVYDYLELSALAFGGIGGGRFGDDIDLGRGDIADGRTAPHCVWGHAAAAAVGENPSAPYGFGSPRNNEVTDALTAVCIDYSANDFAVEMINDRRGHGVDDRVPFKAWAKALGVVRGGA